MSSMVMFTHIAQNTHGLY